MADAFDYYERSKRLLMDQRLRDQQVEEYKRKNRFDKENYANSIRQAVLATEQQRLANQSQQNQNWLFGQTKDDQVRRVGLENESMAAGTESVKYQTDYDRRTEDIRKRTAQAEANYRNSLARSADVEADFNERNAGERDSQFITQGQKLKADLAKLDYENISNQEDRELMKKSLVGQYAKKAIETYPDDPEMQAQMIKTLSYGQKNIPFKDWNEGDLTAEKIKQYAGFPVQSSSGKSERELAQTDRYYDIMEQRNQIEAEKGRTYDNSVNYNYDPTKQFQKNAASAEGKKMGESKWERVESSENIIRTSKQLINIIDELEQHEGLQPGTGTSAKYVTALKDRLGVATVGGDFQVYLDQLKGGVFAQAYESLRGGGQITEYESRTIAQGLARLDTVVTEPAFREALADFKSKLQASGDRANRVHKYLSALPEGARINLRDVDKDLFDYYENNGVNLNGSNQGAKTQKIENTSNTVDVSLDDFNSWTNGGM